MSGANLNQAALKGIILAEGSGARLFPVMLAGIRDILIISTPQDAPMFDQLLGYGTRFGLNFQYAVQSRPEGTDSRRQA
jgi:glucose-1-phosphate thymidylyltransferase